MKKLFSLIFVLFVTLLLVAPVYSAVYDYEASVYKMTNSSGTQGGEVLITTGIQFVVLDVGTDDYSTIKILGSTTSITNPVTSTSFASDTICQDKVRFRSANSSCDLIVTDENGGFSVVIEGFTPYDHRIVINEKSGIVHHGIVPFKFLAGGTEVDTGVNFLPYTAIMDVWVEVTTLDAGVTIDVGCADDPNGYRTGVSVAATGFIKDPAFITDGNTLDYIPATTYGEDLVTAVSGSDAVASGGGRSWIGPLFVEDVDTDDDLTYTPSSSDTAYGFIHYWFVKIR